MRRAALLALSLLACQKATAPNRTLPEPPDLVATGAVASPEAAVAGLAAYVEQISPGGGALFTAPNLGRALGEIVGEPELAGLDLSKPLYLLLLDPKTHDRPVVLFGVPADAQKLGAAKNVKVTVQGGHAIVGEAKAVDLVSAYAFAALATRPAPAAPTFWCSPTKLFTRYRADIDAFRKQTVPALTSSSPMVGKIFDTEIDLFGKLADQSDEVRLTVDLNRGEGVLDIALAPRADTPFAKFVALQPRSLDDSKLSLLPVPADPTMVGAGRYQLGPLRPLLLDLLASFLDPKLDRAKWGALFDLFDGTMAMSSTSGKDGMSVQEVLGVSDGARVAALLLELLPASGPKPLEMMGMKMTWEMKGATAKHGSVPVIEAAMTFDWSSFPEQQREMMKKMYGGDSVHVYYAGAGKTFAVAMGKDGLEQIGRMLDGAGAKPPAPATATIDAGRGRKAAVVMYMNILRSMGALLGDTAPAKSGVDVEMAYGDGALHIRLGMPTAHVQEIMHAFSARH